MPFDALALHAIRDEVEPSLVGGRVQKAYLVDEHSLALEVYADQRRRWLLASAHPEAARVHFVAKAPVRGTERVTPFGLLVRKHIRDARLVAVRQPPLERILELGFTYREEGGLRREVVLVLELMGRRSNMVLLDEDGTILDCLRRVSAQTNPARPLVPHARYAPPPAPDRLDPRRATSYFALEERLKSSAGERTLAQVLVAHLAGLSPLAAEEIAFRATGQHQAKPERPLPWAALERAAAELFAPLETHAWEPHLILRGGEPFDATPYRPRQFSDADLQAMPGTSEAFEQLQTGPRRLAPHAVARAPLQAALDERRSQLDRKLAALQRSLEGAERADALRASGQAILANLHALSPGQERLVFGDQEVALDPTRTPLENAQRYFEEYTRARDATRVVPELIDQTQLERRYVDEMAAQVTLAADPAAIEELRRELVANGLVAPNRGEAKRGRPAPPRGGHRRVHVDGFDVLLGTSAAGNERVTFELSAPDDLWLHARGVPGSHVVVRSGGRTVPVEVVERAARLAAQHSTARDDATVLVDWVRRKHVRKIRGGPPGLVSYTQEQTLRVRPNETQHPEGAEHRAASSDE